MQLSILLALVATSLVTAQDWVSGTAYCGEGTSPVLADCQAALAKIDAGSTYSTTDPNPHIASGSCTIQYNSVLALPNGALSGQTLINEINAIFNACSNTIGWFLDSSSANVTITQCLICQGSLCSVCVDPQEEKVEPKKVEPKKVKKGPSRFPQLSSHVRRQQEPANLVWCDPGPGVKVSDCQDLANEIDGQTLILPFVSGSGDCIVAVEEKSNGQTANGADVANMIRTDGPLCQSSGAAYIGSVKDSNNAAYDVFFGGFCGEFGNGQALCSGDPGNGGR